MEIVDAGIDGQDDMKHIYGTKGHGIQHKGRRESKVDERFD